MINEELLNQSIEDGNQQTESEQQEEESKNDEEEDNTRLEDEDCATAVVRVSPIRAAGRRGGEKKFD